MEYFLPIAQVEINIPIIFFLSLFVGVLSGLFGVGGGFLMTPFLIFLESHLPMQFQMKLAIYWNFCFWFNYTLFKRTLDYKMGLMIVLEGVLELY